MKAAVALLVVVLLVASAQCASSSSVGVSQDLMLKSSAISRLLEIPECTFLTLWQGTASLIGDVIPDCIDSGSIRKDISCVLSEVALIAGDVLHSLATCGNH